MATRQSTVRLPERSWQQVAELAGIFGDNTKVFLVAIDRLYQQEVVKMSSHHYSTGEEILGSDIVKFPDGDLAHIVIPGADRSLVEFRNKDAHLDERIWFDNDRLTLVRSPKRELENLEK